MQVVKPTISTPATGAGSTSSSCPSNCGQTCAIQCPQTCCSSTTQTPATTPTSTAPTTAVTTPVATAKPTPKVVVPKPVSCMAPVCSKPQTCQQSCPKPVCCKRFKDMVEGCPRVCFRSCEQVCPRRCCGPHPPIRDFAQRPKISDIPEAPACPEICADVCALECPHRCCGPGSVKRSLVAQRPQLAYMKNYYSYAARNFQVPRVQIPQPAQMPFSRYSRPRGYGLKKKRDATHEQ